MSILHDYWRSSASWRVRITLAVKGISWQSHSHDLTRNEQRDPNYLTLNPQGLVPAWEEADGWTISQSIAILEYLEERFPTPALLPASPRARAEVRSLVQTIACDIHPLNNLRVLKYLTGELGLSEDQKLAWYRHWVVEGFDALEPQLASDPATGRYCHGDQPGLADVALVPQVANARRFGVDLAPYPTIWRIDEACRQLEPFRSAAPENQPDAE